MPNPRCQECREQSLTLKNKFNDYCILRESLTDRLEWVFSAFGLLVDNSIILKATDCRVVFQSLHKEKYCLIQDNGSPSHLWDKAADFISDLLATKTYV